MFAVLLAAPLFQTIRDEGAWRFPYPRLHGHAWTDAVIGAVSLAFVGVTFLLAWLIAGLFDVIGIGLIKERCARRGSGGCWPGSRSAARSGCCASATSWRGRCCGWRWSCWACWRRCWRWRWGLFLLSMPFTGLGGLWDSAIPATPLMLVAGAGAVLLANAVIGNGEEERATSRVLRLSAMVLVLAVLPLALIAALSLGQRIGQYGWTPERMWGAVAVAVALVYGAVGWWAVARPRCEFDEGLRSLQTRLAIGLCGVALVLALADRRLRRDVGGVADGAAGAGQGRADEFDWQAMAFDFGPVGRRRLAEIARAGPAGQREFAAAALATKNRYEVETEVARGPARRRSIAVAGRARGSAIPPALRLAVARDALLPGRACVVVLVAPDRAIVAGSPGEARERAEPDAGAQCRGRVGRARCRPGRSRRPGDRSGPISAPRRVEVRTVERRILFVDGRPVGEVFE